MSSLRRWIYAYAVADLVVARAGAISVSELCLVQKPAILVPLPTAAEDHQTHNARALTDRGAAVLVAMMRIRHGTTWDRSCISLDQGPGRPGAFAHGDRRNGNPQCSRGHRGRGHPIGTTMSERLSGHRFYFIGVGGIGMSGLARYFRRRGAEVAGYDRTPSELTNQLQSGRHRCAVQRGSHAMIPEEFRQAGNR
jgi:hypothetical protein